MELGGQETQAEAFAQALPTVHGLQEVAAVDSDTSPGGHSSQSKLWLLRKEPMGHASDWLAATDKVGGATETAEGETWEKTASDELRSCMEMDAPKLKATPMLELTRTASVPFWIVTAKLACRLAADRWRRAAPLETLVMETAEAETLSVDVMADRRDAFWAPPKSLAATPLMLSTDATV
jgi:hypothetical protein